MAIQESRQERQPQRGHVRASRRHNVGYGRDGHDPVAERLATGLGWFSIGLGLAEVVAPKRVAQVAGIPDDDTHCRMLQGAGAREIASGVGILALPGQAGWVWSRVAGDAMDLALLGEAFTSDRSRRDRVAVATAAVLGVTALDVLCAQRLSARPGPTAPRRFGQLAAPRARERAIHVTEAMTVGRPVEEVYAFWRDFRNLPRVMRYIESVRVIDDRRSHWKAKAPFGRTVEWDSEIVEDRPNERIAWRSLEAADVPNSGRVSFERAPGGRGTVVRVELQYDPPGGMIGATIAKLFGTEPEQQLEDDLRHFKQVMEVGEIIQSEASVKGGGAAQPPAELPRH